MEPFNTRSVATLRRAGSSARAAAWCLAGLVALALVLVGFPTPAQAAAPGTCRSTPFRTNAGNRVVYRIPAMVATTRGTILAFAERRRSISPAADTGDNEVVVARSTDRGCHWSAPLVIADRGTDTVGNPVPVVDTTTGAILLFTVDRPRGGTTYRGLHLQRSTDDGRTFTPYSKARLDLTNVPGWSGGLTGPGHAIQLHAAASPHRGRLVVPMGYKRDDRYGVYGLISDDHGKSWRVGYNTLTDGRIEGTVAELPNGRLWVSYRNRDARAAVGTGRVGAYSKTGGSSLDGPLKRAGLPVVSVQGSALGLTGRYAGTLLFSSPARQDPTRRHRMAIFASSGAGAGTRWGAPYDVQLDDRPAAYSDLVQLSDTTIGILYETGQTSWKERIDFRSMRISAIVGRAQVGASLSVAAPSRLRAGATLRPTLTVRVNGTSSPAGKFTARVRGNGVDRSQTLPLFGNSQGRRVASLGTLSRGTYALEIRYPGTSRIRPATTTRRITVH